MANCKKCGTALPPVTFGELSDLCATCRAQEVAPRKQSIASALPRLAATSITWPLATVVLIGISVSVFAAMVKTGVSAIQPTSAELLRWGADYGPYTLASQYFRLVTSAFVHIGFLHLAVNMISLWILGRMVEKLFGAVITFAVYLLTAVGAALLTLSWDPMRVSAGASGAIFGLDGVLIAVLYYGKLELDSGLVRRALGWVVKIALLNLLYGLRGNTDNMAHLGGLVTGLLAGIFLAHTFVSPAQDRFLRQARILATTALALLIVLVPVKHAKAYAVELWAGQTALERDDYNAAIIHLQKYILAKPNDGRGHAELGYAFQMAERVEDAESEYQRALALEPDMPWVQLNLAGIYWDQHNAEQAVVLYRAGIAGGRPGAEEYSSYGAALLSLHRYSEAADALQHALALDEKDPSVHELLAEAYDGLHKLKEAKLQRQRASELESAPRQSVPRP